MKSSILLEIIFHLLCGPLFNFCVLSLFCKRGKATQELNLSALYTSSSAWLPLLLISFFVVFISHVVTTLWSHYLTAPAQSHL